MKNSIILFILLSGFISRAQTKDTAYAKLNGGCLLSGGLINVTDYNKIKRLCPAKLTRVIRYTFYHQPKGKLRKNAHKIFVECLGEDFVYPIPALKPGDIIIYDEIVGLNANKKRTAAESIILTIK